MGLLTILGYCVLLLVIVGVVVVLLVSKAGDDPETHERIRKEQADMQAAIERRRAEYRAAHGITPMPAAPTVRTVPSSKVASAPSAPESIPAPSYPAMSNHVPDLWEFVMREADTLLNMVSFATCGACVTVTGRVGTFMEGPRGGLILELGDKDLSATVPVFLPDQVAAHVGEPSWGQVITVRGTIQAGKRKGIVASHWQDILTQVA